MLKLIKPFICVTFILTALNANAQVAVLQNAIDKLASYKNFSYQYVYKQKEVFSDTLLNKGKYALLKKPDNKEVGYFFRHDWVQSGMKDMVIDVFDGGNVMTLNPVDSTFSKSSRKVDLLSGMLIGGLNWLKTFANKNLTKITQVNDTVVHSISSYHLIFNTRDTIINKQHLYTRIHLLIDKITGLPLEKFIKARTDSFGKEIADYYTQESYFDYKIDQDNINTAYFNMPAGFHLQKEKSRQEVALLPPGLAAPDWTLYDTGGEKTSLSLLKGKIVLIDFFFVGCVPCMSSLGPLERLSEKYNNKKFVVLSISDRDDKKLVTAFKKAQRIKNQMYPNGGDVAKLYHMTAAPTFYFIDKEGKIANTMVGYHDDFEKKATLIIDNLLSK